MQQIHYIEPSCLVNKLRLEPPSSELLHTQPLNPLKGHCETVEEFRLCTWWYDLDNMKDAEEGVQFQDGITPMRKMSDNL